jgi:hypothetical protein
MNKYLPIVCVTIILCSASAEGQRHRPPGLERVERFKKMELLDVLKLDEEKAVRFSVRLDGHEDKMKELRDARKRAIDELDDMLEKKADPKEYQKLFDNVYENDQSMFSERKRYLDEMRAFLTAEQFAKFLVFERSFEMKLRKAMREIRRERFERQPN